MELKPGYKMTEVGIIPCEWDVPSLGYLTELMTNGFVGAAKPHYAPNENGVLYVQGYNVEENSFNFNGIKFVTKAFHKSHMRSCLQTGDLLTVQTGDVGLTTVVPEFLAGANCHALIISRFNSKRASSVFISYYLNSKPGRSRLRLIETGTTMKHLNVGDVLDFVVPLPPTIAEQEAIAEALSDADALIESLEQLLVKKRQVKHGATQELLTGRKRLPGFTASWENTHFGALGTIYGGLAGKTKQDFECGNARYITFMNVMANTAIDSEILQFVDVRPHESQNEVMRGDILFNGSSETPEEVGMAAYVSTVFDRVYLNSFCFGFRQHQPEAVDGLFLAYYFRSQVGRELLKSLAQGAIRYNLSKTALLKLRLPLPSKPEQVSIAASLSDMDAEIAAVKSRIIKARQIKQGMMQELLTGRIRLARRSAQVLSFPVKETTSVAKVSHNTQINEAVVIAVLSANFGSETFPLGRFRRTKFSYLLHRHVEHEAAGFMKKAAGPYNPQTRYGGAEKIALQNRYVRIIHTQKGEGFVADEKIAQAEDYFNKWYGAEALTWLEQFRYQKNDALELLTTVDMACEDLSRAGKAVTLATVKQVIHDSTEWKAKLNRSVFSDDNIATTIQSCGQLFPIEEE